MIADLFDEPLVAEGVLADEEAQVDDEVAAAEGTGADDFYATLPCMKRPGRLLLTIRKRFSGLTPKMTAFEARNGCLYTRNFGPLQHSTPAQHC